MKRPNASLAIQVLPQVEGNKVIDIVDKVIAYLKSTGLKVFVGPFESTIEGDFEKLFDIAKRCQEICSEEGASLVYCYMKMAYSPENGVYSIEEKTAKHQ